MTPTGRDVRPVRTVFLGSGGFAVPILRALEAHPSLVLVGVVTAPPRPAGRRGDLRPTPVAEAAPRDLPLLTPARLRDAASLEAILALDPALAVLADYGQIVPPALLDLPYGALNLHPSLLPRHRGASPIPATILAGDPETAVTLMRMDEGLDTGPVIAAMPVPLRGDETAPELEAALADAASDLIVAKLDAWLRGVAPAVSQRAEDATLTRPLRREDGRLDPSRSAEELARHVRAFQPWPGSFIDTVVGRVTVLAARTEEGPAGAGPAGAGPADAGRIDERGLGTADGWLALETVQPAGGHPMPWPAFLRGRPGILGTRVVAAG